jgi:hypothetical protein
VSVAVRIAGIGLLGPGLSDWTSGEALLRDPAGWQRTPTVVPPPSRLPATERRRAGPVVKCAIVVADQAVAASGLSPAELPTVFASSTGEPSNCHALCEALAAPERMVSPTRFTNSVHNAAAGYWHIAAQAMAPSTSLSAFDASFGAGLLEAAVQCATLAKAVLLVACDVPYPEPLHSKRPLADTFGVAFVLSPAGNGPVLRLSTAGDSEPTPCAHAGFDELRRHIPAARALPLLEALARRRAGPLVVEGLAGMAIAAELVFP